VNLATSGFNCNGNSGISERAGHHGGYHPACRHR